MQEEVLEGLFSVPVIGYIKQLGPGYAADKYPQHQVGYIFRTEADLHAAPAGGPHANHKTCCQKDTVPMNGDPADVKSHRMHRATLGFEEGNRQARLIWLLIKLILR